MFYAASAAAERRAALVFGADAYRALRPLDNGGRDAARVAEVLRGLGFEVMLETDRDLRRMRRALEDFEADYKGSEVAVIFYAGHGVELSGRNLLLPVDADPSSLEALAASALPLEEVRDVAVRVAPVAIILIDACREDPFGAALAEAGRGGVRLAPAAVKAEVKPGMGRMGDARSTLFAFSTAPGALAADGDSNSPFTQALAKYLATPGVEIRSALTLVQQEVYDTTGGMQLPYIENGLPQLYFVGARDGGDLPERERLLLAMAGIDEATRADIETVARDRQVPLATLYGAVLSSGLDGGGDLRAGLAEAAESYLQLSAMMRNFSAADPEVQALREAAEERLRLGALNEALDLVRQARSRDAEALGDIGRIRVERILSSAVSAQLEAQISRTALDHVSAIAALEEGEALYRSIESEALTDEHYFNRGSMLFDLGVLRVNLGDTTGAIAAFTDLMRASILWEEHGSEDTRLWQQRGRALMALGHLHTERAEIEPALAALAEASAIFNALLEVMPGAPTLLYDLINMLMMQGDLELRQGRAEVALRRLTEAVDVAEAELARSPENPLLEEILAKALDRLGSAQWGVFELAAAEASFRRAEQLTRAQAAGDDPDKRRSLMVAVMSLAAVLRENHEPAALDYFTEAAAISAEGLARDPQNMLRLSDRHAAVGELAATLILYGRRDEALLNLREALRLGKHLSALDPEKTEWQRALALTHMSLAEAGDAPLSNLLAGRGLLVGLDRSGKLGPNEAKLLALFDQALRDLERGNWPPATKAPVGTASAAPPVEPRSADAAAEGSGAAALPEITLPETEVPEGTQSTPNNRRRR